MALLSLGLLTACGTPNYHFTAYVGQQRNWTTSPGSYVKIVEDVQIYNQYPSKPYELVGAVNVGSEKALARAVKFYHADAAIIYDRYSHLNGSMVLAGPPGYVAYPLTDSRITAQLVRFK
jgi:hypothetical protein